MTRQCMLSKSSTNCSQYTRLQAGLYSYLVETEAHVSKRPTQMATAVAVPKASMETTVKVRIKSGLQSCILGTISTRLTQHTLSCHCLLLWSVNSEFSRHITLIIAFQSTPRWVLIASLPSYAVKQSIAIAGSVKGNSWTPFGADCYSRKWLADQCSSR